MADKLGVREAADLTDRQHGELRRQKEKGKMAYYRNGRLYFREKQRSPRRGYPPRTGQERRQNGYPPHPASHHQDGHPPHPAPRRQPAGEPNDAPPPMDDMQVYPTLGRQRSPTRGDRQSPFWDETTPHEPQPARISSQPETIPRTTLDQCCDKGAVPGDSHCGDAVPASQETGSNGGIGAAARSAHLDHTDCATPRSHSPCTDRPDTSPRDGSAIAQPHPPAAPPDQLDHSSTLAEQVYTCAYGVS